MALPYPEGSVYFRRTALRLPTPPWNFDVQNERTFYSHCLIENVWNTEAFHYGTSTPSPGTLETHPRSRVVVGQGQSYRTRFGKSKVTPLKSGSFLLREWALRSMG